MKTIILSLALSLVTLSVAAATLPSAQGDKTSGEKLFSVNCVACHGPKGAGDGPAAVALNPKPRNLQTEPFKGGDSADKVLATISVGLPKSAMPGFPQLKETERKDLVAFVLSLRKK